MSTKNSKSVLHNNKSSCVTSIQGRFTPDFRVESMRSKSFDKNPEHNSSRYSINTPNFSKREPNPILADEYFDKQTTFGHEKKLHIPKLPLDTLLEDDSVSLNLSTICLDTPENFKSKKPNEASDLLHLLENPEDWENSNIIKKKYSCLDESSVVESQCKILVSNKNTSNVAPINEMLRKQSQKYDKALIMLQAHFQTYKDNSEKQILALTRELADAKAILKYQSQDRNSLVAVFKNKLKQAKCELEAQFKLHLNSLEKRLSDKEQTKRESTDERISQLRKDFEKKSADSSRDERPKSSSRGYVVLVEENRKLREDLTNLWKDTDKINSKLKKK
jgi:hypothetical protein